MKKRVLSCILTLVLCAMPSMVNAYSIEEVDSSAWTEGLKPGEKVVAVYTEGANVDDEIIYDNLKPEIVRPCEANLRWFATSKESMGSVGGNWKYAGASTVSGGVLHASHSNEIANKFEGNLTVSMNDLNAFVGFNVTHKQSLTVGYHTNNLPKIKGKGHRLEYRHKYTKYKVLQEKKYDRRANKVYGTAYVYPMKWVEREYRVVEYTL